MQTIFTEISCKDILTMESVQRCSMDLLSNHKEEKESAEIFSSSTTFMP